MSENVIVEPLPYEYNALEPHIDGKTMELHHSKHYAGYVSKYNAAVKGTEYQDMDLDQVLSQLDSVHEDIRASVRNAGGGASNHAKFWQWMTPESTSPSEELRAAIESTFSSMDNFKEEFKQAALGQFGSGWAWLVVDSGALSIVSTPNQDTPISKGMKPILGIDVWEHAMYLKYQNRKPEYIDAWFNVVNWEKVSQDYQDALGGN